MRPEGAAQGRKSPCSIKNSPVPETISCPKCGDGIEVWTDEEEAACGRCGQQVIRRTGVSAESV